MQAFCSTHVVAREGPLPVGANTWKVRGDGKWQKHTLTVTLLP